MMTVELSTIHTGIIIAVDNFGRLLALVWTGEGRTGSLSSRGPISSMITLIFSPINLSVSSIDDEDDMLGLAKGS